VYVDEADGDREKSLLRMRTEMLSRNDLESAVFVGGMEGILVEHRLFQQFNPTAKVLPVSAAGGAARELAQQLGVSHKKELDDVNFAEFFYTRLNIAPDEPRTVSA
jgi:SLOG cluster3 family